MGGNFTFGIRVHIPVLFPPGKEVPEFCKKIARVCDELEEKYSIPVFWVGGFMVDRGWLFGFNIIYDESNPEQWKQAKLAGEELMDIAYESGVVPYRVGTYWAKYIQQLGTYYEVLKQIKSVIDPNGIMSPGVLGL